MWDYRLASLPRYGFGKTFHQWIQLLCTNPTSIITSELASKALFQEWVPVSPFWASFSSTLSSFASESIGSLYDWPLPWERFALGDPTRSFSAPGTQLPGSQGVLKPLHSHKVAISLKRLWENDKREDSTPLPASVWWLPVSIRIDFKVPLLIWKALHTKHRLISVTACLFVAKNSQIHHFDVPRDVPQGVKWGCFLFLQPQTVKQPPFRFENGKFPCCF